MDSAAGFFGKVTSHGDFVLRRLPPPFVQPWDAWLQSALSSSREQLRGAWLGSYLSSPIWRFALAPGVCGASAWAGVLMPSIDRVGRHFPLTLGASLDSATSLPDWMVRAGAWYDRLESLALWSLQEDFSLELFDALLGEISLPMHEGCAPAGPPTLPGTFRNQVLEVPGLDRLSAVTRDLRTAPTARTLWWTDGSEQVSPCVLHCQGLPPAAGFAAMLDGRWSERGWQVQAAGGVSPAQPGTAP